MISTLFPHPVSLVPRKAEISSRAPKKAAQTSDGVQGIHAFCEMKVFQGTPRFSKKNPHVIHCDCTFLSEWLVKSKKNKDVFIFEDLKLGDLLPSVTWDVQTNKNTMTVGKCWHVS